MKKSLLFLTSSNLSVNPRLYKELLLAAEAGYHITFVGFKLGMWSDENDKKLIQAFKNLDAVYLDATRSKFFPWIYYAITEKMARFAWPLFKRSYLVTITAHTKRSLALLRALRRLNGKKFDLVIGHNLPALYPAYIASKKFNCGFAFDVEDYHPGEVSPIEERDEKTRREFLMVEFLPKAKYVSSASPLITAKVESTISGLPSIFTVNNSFKSKEFHVPADLTKSKLQLVWFSQNISAGRGLELVLNGWKNLSSYCELTLIGKIDPLFSETISLAGPGVTILEPMDQPTLHKSIGNYDIGLALDLSSANFNRQLALTNKIIAYAQAGLYVLATDTPAQKEFLEQHPHAGETVEQDTGKMISALENIFQRHNLIRRNRIKRYELAKEFSWDVESGKLKQAWSEILSNQ